jgi:hypothetical protein
VHDPLKVFISSTSDAKRWRKAASDAVASENLDVNRYEDWYASPSHSLDECLLRVKESDAFILLIKEKYGTIYKGFSITHREYKQAKEIGLPYIPGLEPSEFE